MQCLGVEPVVEPGDLVPRWPGGETAGESDSLPAPTGFLKKTQYNRNFIFGEAVRNSVDDT